jgi:hypothetical protein
MLNAAALKTEFQKRVNLQRWRKDPLKWMEERMGMAPETIKWSLNPEYKNHKWDDIAEPITPDPIWQMFDGLANGEHVGVESGTGLGKSFGAALAVLWFLDCFPPEYDKHGKLTYPGGLVMCISSKQDQLRDVLWNEIRRHWDKFSVFHPEAEILDLKIRMNPNDEQIKDAWVAVGLTASVGADEQSASKIQGYHRRDMLIVLDEATGINPAILEAVFNTCSDEHNLILALGNPENQTDTLHMFCTMDTVRHIRASAIDHPNVVKGFSFIPGAVSQKSIDDRMARYKSPTHRMILSRVHGVSPSTSGMSMFSPEAIDKTLKNLATPIRTVKPPPTSIGEIRIYEDCKHDFINRYIIFADVAGDRSDKGDYQAAVVFDRIDKKPVAVVRIRGPRKDYISALLRLTTTYTIKYGYTGAIADDGSEIKKEFKPMLAYEQNGVGSLHLDDRIDKYPNLYHKRSLGVKNPNVRTSIGWDTTPKTRKIMMDNLEEWGMELTEHPKRMVDKELWAECRTFSWNDRKKRFEAETGHHDDLCMALAGALTVDKLISSYKDVGIYEREKPKDLTHHDKFMGDTRKSSGDSMFDVEDSEMFDILIENLP